MYRKWTPEKQLAFLAVLEETGMVGTACEAIGVSRQTPHNWANEDPEFRLAWIKSEKIAGGRLKDELTRRALEEHQEKTYNAKGELVKMVTKPNDKMLLAALQARERAEAKAEAQERKEAETRNSFKGLDPEQVAKRLNNILKTAALRREARLNQAVLELV